MMDLGLKYLAQALRASQLTKLLCVLCVLIIVFAHSNSYSAQATLLSDEGLLYLTNYITSSKLVLLE